MNEVMEMFVQHMPLFIMTYKPLKLLKVESQ